MALGLEACSLAPLQLAPPPPVQVQPVPAANPQPAAPALQLAATHVVLALPAGADVVIQAAEINGQAIAEVTLPPAPPAPEIAPTPANRGCVGFSACTARFLNSLTGIVSALAALLVAMTGLRTAWKKFGRDAGSPQPASTDEDG